MTELELALADAGGADAPPEQSARLRELLVRELRRGPRELRLARTGYPDPIVIALAPADRRVLAALPLEPELRADPDAVGERAGMLAAAVVEKLVEATDPGPAATVDELSLLLGDFEGSLGIAYPAADPGYAAEYARVALGDLFEATDRLRCDVHVFPAHALDGVEDLREPIGATHPLRIAEAAARQGISPLDEEAMEGLVPRAHDDPDPARRVARRILQRLDGMGKWGGYHTEFDHLARGFGQGNEKAHAKEVGEALLDAGLLVEKTSVGQRHVSLNPRRSGDIRRFVDDGEPPAGLRLPPWTAQAG